MTEDFEIDEADNPIAAASDAAVRNAMSGTSMLFLTPSCDAAHVVASIWTGGIAATARYAWAMRRPGVTIEQMADSFRDVALSFFAQAEANESGGRA